MKTSRSIIACSPVVGALVVGSLVVGSVLICPPVTAASRDDRGFDPTGVWYGQHGPLSLMRAGDTLTFSYSAVFGASAHLCDGIGVAGFVGNATWTYVDKQGTTAFTTKGNKVTMRTTKGIASFCGANWPGDSFGKDGWKPAFTCTVVTPKARFLTATATPAVRNGYVVRGNTVEAVGLVNEGTPAWLLARYVAKKQTTAGLLERDALSCSED